MGMLSTMPYLNIRHQLPQIAIHQTQAYTERSGVIPAELHRDYEAPLADVAATQVDVDIDTYQCRKAYGFLNNNDFAAKYGQEGFADAQSVTSEHTNTGWSLAKNAAKPGNSIGSMEKSKFFSQFSKFPQWVAKDIPDPQFTVTPSEIVGQMDPGSDTMNISTTGSADIAIAPGTAQTSLKDRGYLRQWVTYGHYDIYA